MIIADHRWSSMINADEKDFHELQIMNNIFYFTCSPFRINPVPLQSARTLSHRKSYINPFLMLWPNVLCFRIWEENICEEICNCQLKLGRLRNWALYDVVRHSFEANGVKRFKIAGGCARRTKFGPARRPKVVERIKGQYAVGYQPSIFKVGYKLLCCMS